MSGASAIHGRISSSHVAPHFETPHDVTARHAARVESTSVGSSTPPPPAAAAPLLFTIDGSGLLARRTASASGEQRGRRVARPLRVNSGIPTSRGGEGAGSGGAERRAGRSAATLLMPSVGLLPSAVAAPFTMRGVSCGTPLSSSGNAARVSGSDGARPGSAGGSVKPPSRRTASPAAATAHTQPRVNNYLAGSAATPGLRTASANRAAKPRRPPRAPTVASLSTSPSLTRASSCETSASSLHHGERETAESGVRDDTTRRAGHGAAQGAASLSSADRVSSASGAAPPLPVRPLLRPPPPPHAAVAAAAAHEDAYHAAEAGSTSSANTTTARSDASGSSRTASKAPKRPNVPLVQMTRTFALRRPVLLTKDTSAAAAAAAGGRKPTRADAPEASTESPLSPVVLQATTASAAQPSSADICSPAYAPMPPRVSGQTRRLRRTSLASLASNSSAALHSRQQHSLDDEAAATRFFFSRMPSFTDAEAGAEERSAADDAPYPSDAAADTAAATATATASARTAAAPVRAPPAASFPTRRDRSVDHGGGHLRNAVYGSSRSINSLRYDKGAENHHSHHRPSSQRGRRSSASELGNSYAASAAAAAAAVAAATTNAGGVIERLRERGNQYMLREEFAQAIATYSEAIRLAPRYDVLWGNRAAAFLLTFRYLPAVADCLYVLNLKPGSVKAYWRAAKAYAAAHRFLDAKKYYLLAQQACLKEVSRATPTSAAAAALDGGCEASGSSVFGKSSSSAGDAAEKAARDRRAIEAEEQAVAKVEAYWQHMRSERWAEAVAVVDSILAMASYTGPTAVSWQALRLEALLFLHPKAAFAEAEALHRRYPEALELYYVLAKSLFHTVHDAGSTRRCVQLLDAAAERRSAQNTLLNVHVRYAAMQLREGQCSEGGDTAAVQLEAWGRRNQLREDSLMAELRYSIEKFARHRDAGNAAYERGNWEAAVAAYTQCLQTDRLNHALLAAVYCNRTAVYMQAGRWREALSDADAAIQHSPQLATAYGRRGRIQLYLLSQEYEAQRMVLARHYATQWSAAAREQLTRYADAAAADLTRAVELAPTAEHKMQLQQALAQRQTVKAALSAQPSRERQGSTSGPSSSSSTRGVPRPGGASGEGSAHQRTFPNSHPASSASSTATSLYASLQQHLHLLGLHASSATPNALPDLKVIAKAYRECALRWHPDKWVSSTPQEQQEAERQFKLISLAYTALRERCSDAAKVS